MKRLAITFTFLITTMIAACSLAEADSAGKFPPDQPRPASVDFIATEITGRPTADSVTVNVVPAVAMELYYEYGPSPDGYTAQTAPQTALAAAPLETLIDGLQPDTRYYYRLRYRLDSGDFAAGSEHTFVTQRAPGSTFTFDVQADSHPERVRKQFSPDLYRRTLLNAAADQPDFYLTLGDDFSVDALKTVTAHTVAQVYLNQRQYLGLVGSDAPLFLVNGNHEQAALVNLDGTPDNVAVWAQTARNAYFPQPAPDNFYRGDTEPVEFIGPLRDYYAWEWGDALFVVIDPYWHSPVPVDNRFGGGDKTGDRWAITLGDAQYQWLSQTLAQSSAKFKFVFAHHVNGTGRGGIEQAGQYEWGDAANLAAHRPGWAKTIHQLLVDNHVTIFFQGHDHLFVRQELDGVIYQTLPTPADPNYALDNANAYRSGDKLPASGHLRVTVSPDNVTVAYIRAFLPQDETTDQTNGQVAYSYTVGPAAAQPDDAPAEAVNIILGRPTADSIVASVLTGQELTGYIAFGPQPGDLSAQTPLCQFSNGEPTEVRLEALQPDTAYAYQLFYQTENGGEFIAGPAGRFQTQRAPGSPFTFTVQADSHLDANTSPDLYRRTLLNAAADRPDFHLDLGDTFMTDKFQPFTAAAGQYLAQRDYLSLVGRTAPLFLVLGNHDGEWMARPNTGSGAMPTWSAQRRTRHFPNPIPDDFYAGNLTPDADVGPLQNYYAWEWGDALLVALDPYRFTPPRRGRADNWYSTLGSEQYQWLQNTLATSSARYKFIFIHQLVGGLGEAGRGGVEAAPFFEWGGANADGSWGFATQRPDWEQPIHPLLVEHHVTAVFHGHDHLFIKQELDGIVYQTVPQPGALRADAGQLAEEYGYLSGQAVDGAGYLRVTVAPAQVTVDFMRTLPAANQPAEVAYTYTISNQGSVAPSIH